MASELAGGVRPLAAADVLGRLRDCESRVCQVQGYAARIPAMDKAYQDLQGRIVHDWTRLESRIQDVETGQSEAAMRMGTVSVVKLGSRVKDLETGLFEAAKRMGTVSVAKLGCFVESLSTQIVGLEGRLPNDSAAERRLVQERLDGHEAQLSRLATVTIPGLIANGLAQGLALAMPEVTASIASTVTAEVMEAIPRLLAAGRDRDQRAPSASGDDDGNDADDGDEDDIVWTKSYRIPTD